MPYAAEAERGVADEIKRLEDEIQDIVQEMEAAGDPEKVKELEKQHADIKTRIEELKESSHGSAT